MKKKKKSAPAHVTASIKKRMMITVGIIVCGFCLLTINLIKISIIDHDRYSSLATGQYLRNTTIAATRGTIYDTNMNILVQSAPAWTIAISPKDVEEEHYEMLATELSEVLNIDYQTIIDKFGENNYYSIVQRKVDQPLADRIRRFVDDNGIDGVIFDEDPKRYYRYDNFAAQVLGFVGVDNQGLAGLEAYYDDVLSGTPGSRMSAKNAVGSDMYYDYETFYEPTPGNSLVLTIDEVIQHSLEKHLEAALLEHNVQKRVTGIVIDVNTGEILAMAIKGDFNPNDPLTIFDENTRAAIDAITDPDTKAAAIFEAQQLQWRNKAVSDIYEPGSVFKIVTASAALETGACTMSSTFYCGGSTEVGGHIMHCANRNGHGSQDFGQAVVNSCNPAFIDIGSRIGSSDFYKYFEAFGLAGKTGIDLPAEAQSLFYNADGLGAVELASSSYGQSLSITPIQMITAAAAAVNGGYLVRPHVVKQIIDTDGNIVESYDTEVKRQVISAETSAAMDGILERVVSESSGRNAYVSGFRIGGKSGTGQKLSAGEGKYVASFLGIAPADNPEIAVLVLFDEADSYSIYGGTIVGPVVGSIMSDVLPYIGIDPIYTDEELNWIDVATPNIEGMSLTEATAELQKNGLTSQVAGYGTRVVSQFPLAGQSIPRGSVVILYTEEGLENTVTMPDVSGRSIESARSVLKAVGLNIKTSGSNSNSAVAVAQSIPAGSEVTAGTIVTVEFVGDEMDAASIPFYNSLYSEDGIYGCDCAHCHETDHNFLPYDHGLDMIIRKNIGYFYKPIL